MSKIVNFMRRRLNSGYKVLKPICERCGKIYSFGSKGYRNSSKCYCGGKLKMELTEI